MSIETPSLKTLTNRQIELIKCNWKGLSENVSYNDCLDIPKSE